MKRVTRNGMIAVAAASGAMAAALPAFADSAADGSAAGSPGVVSGNTIQLPVHVPLNACGNTVNVVGLLNPAAGNTCVNEGGTKSPAGPRTATSAHGGEKDSPGVLTGNGVQLPIRLPVNVTGNSVNVVGIGNPGVGNRSENTPGEHPHHPARPTPRPPTPTPAPPKRHPDPAAPPRHPAPPAAVASLAHTGTDDLIPAAATSAALLLGGAALYRRFRPGAPR